jgi:hypothetical protein
MKTLKIKDYIISVHNTVKTVIERSDTNGREVGRGQFIIGINHLVGEGKIDEAIKPTNSLLDCFGWGMQK